VAIDPSHAGDLVAKPLRLSDLRNAVLDHPRFVRVTEAVWREARHDGPPVRLGLWSRATPAGA
jgi:hypothetical protein